jgi:ppGpp synthetase/RelA/SpoT-type nucleotidyltranferase
MEFIDDFVARYTREYDYYDQVGRLAQAKLESTLQEAGIRAIVTSRPKSIGRLREKCRQRDTGILYTSVEQIYDDIVDLVGVRVALYFPGERDQVDGIITRLFHLVESRKEFPDATQLRPEKRFSGYSAVHYRVRLQERELTESEQRYALAKIEIQVASVLMHAWSEVEHDLIYKPLAGDLSEDEYAILDQLNGLVLAGEISLERLQEAGQRRITTTGGSFANHYDLANYLLSHAANLASVTQVSAGSISYTDCYSESALPPSKSWRHMSKLFMATSNVVRSQSS